MPAKAKSLRTLKELSRKYPALQDMLFIIGDVPSDQEKSDRTTAIIAGALLDMFLELAIRSKLVPWDDDNEKQLFSGSGPLSTMSAKIDLAYALGLFGKRIHIELHHIREIRNAFAHTVANITFDMPEVANVCARLKTPDLYPPDSPSYKRNSKQRFLFASRMCWIVLSDTANKRRPTAKRFKSIADKLYPELKS